MNAENNTIDKLGWITISNGQVLMTRSVNKDSFYIPGGKRDPGETDHQALEREVFEETSVSLLKDSIEYFETFLSPADGKPNTNVSIKAYFAEYEGVLKPSSEIEELKWVSFEDRGLCSEASRKIVEALESKGLLN